MYFVCMAGCMDSALHDDTREAEVRAAVESVFPFSAVAQFLTLAVKERETQLATLPYVVLGICLYNQMRGVTEPGVLTEALEGGHRGHDIISAIRSETTSLRAALAGYGGVY